MGNGNEVICRWGSNELSCQDPKSKNQRINPNRFTNENKYDGNKLNDITYKYSNKPTTTTHPLVNGCTYCHRNNHTS